MKTIIKVSELAAIALFQSKDKTRYVLNAVCIEFKLNCKPVMVATDGCCLGVVDIGENTCSHNEQWVIPSQHVSEIIGLCRLKRVSEFTIHKSVFYFTVQINDAVGKNLCVLRFKGTELTFPNWYRVVPDGSKPTEKIAIAPNILEKVIKAERLLSKGGSLRFQFNDHLSAVKITTAHPAFLCVVMPMNLK